MRVNYIDSLLKCQGKGRAARLACILWASCRTVPL